MTIIHCLLAIALIIVTLLILIRTFNLFPLKLRPFYKGKVLTDAEESLKAIEMSLNSYADKRRTKLLVGQFLDQSGIEEKQNGLFGVCCFLITTKHSKDKKVLTLRRECLEWLVAIVHSKKHSEIEPKDQEYLDKNTLKIAFAIEALNSCKRTAEVDILLQNVIENRNGEGIWGFNLAEQKGETIPTAIMLRALSTLSINEELSEILYNASVYLKKNYSKNANSYEKLFLLNSISVSKDKVLPETLDNRKDISVESDIKALVKQAYSEVLSNPTKFPNPVNIDYHFEGKTSYFRLAPSGVILLESLVIISGRFLAYLYAFVGKRIFLDIKTNLDEHSFDRDISGHRASSSVVYYTYQLLTMITSKQHPRIPLPNFVRVVIGTIGSFFYFGANLSTNLSFALICSILGFVFIHFFPTNDGITHFGWILVGVAVKYWLDIMSEVIRTITIKK